MSSNPTQPKFGDQGEGVSFPPEDDAEGHRYMAMGEGDGSAARADGGEGQPDGFRAMQADAGQEDDTEGHRAMAADAGDGAPTDGPLGRRLVMADGDEDDTEGHRIVAFSSPDGQPQDGPGGLRSLADGDEDDTEGHRAVFVDGRPAGQPDSADPDGFKAMAEGGDDGPDGIMAR